MITTIPKIAYGIPTERPGQTQKNEKAGDFARHGPEITLQESL
jgi:hypothetical protein